MHIFFFHNISIIYNLYLHLYIYIYIQVHLRDIGDISIYKIYVTPFSYVFSFTTDYNKNNDNSVSGK